MKKTFLYSLIFLSFIPQIVFAEASVPDFSNMKTLRCEVSETIYNQNNSVVTQNKYHRVFNLDDANKSIYLQKDAIYRILSYGDDKIEFQIQSMTDDSIIMSNIQIDRLSGNYISQSEITYDNEAFGVRHAKATGLCTSLN